MSTMFGSASPSSADKLKSLCSLSSTTEGVSGEIARLVHEQNPRESAPPVSFEVSFGKTLGDGESVDMDAESLRETLEALGLDAGRNDTFDLVVADVKSGSLIGGGGVKGAIMKQVIAAYATHDTETGKSIAVIGYSRRRRKRFHKKLRHELRHVADRQERGHDSIPLAQKLTYAIGSKASFASLHLSVSNLGFISANKIAGLVSGNDESMANQLYRDIQPHLEQGQASTLVMALAAATMSAGYILDSREIRARKAEKIDTPELISITR